ncbi:hypothetical protein WN943_026833 [Citrus x changshan-huyou]
MSFALPDLNDEVHIEQITAIEDSLEWMLANDDGDVYADKLTENEIENDLPHSDNEGEFNEVVGAALDDSHLSPKRRMPIAQNYKYEILTVILSDMHSSPRPQVPVALKYNKHVSEILSDGHQSPGDNARRSKS